MRTGSILRRIQKMERVVLPGDGCFTLEALLRAMWREDPARCRAECRGSGGMSLLIPQFEREDVERARKVKR